MDKADRQFSLLERILSIATSVRPGEGKSAAILTLQSFLTLLCYSLIRPAREAIILAEQGAEVRSYATGAQTLLLLVLVPLYGAWFRKNAGSGMIQKLNLFFAVNLLLFFLALNSGIQIGIVFYIWMAIFNVMVISQFWAFTADLYNVKSGQRLFVIIMLGASTGALMGSLVADKLFNLVQVEGLILMAAAILMLTLFLSNMAKNAVPEESRSHHTIDDDAPKPGIMGGFTLIARDPYLIMIALFVVLLNWISTNGDYIIGKFVLNWAEQQVTAGLAESIGSATGSFYAGFFFWVNLTGMLLQALVVSRLFKWIGIRGTILVLPIVMVLAYGLIFIIPVFTLFRWVKISEMGINYSVANTTRQALFLPTSREAKYEGKMAIDTFFWRFGDLISAATVFIGVSFFNFTITEFIATNLFLSVGMLLVALKIGQYHHDKVTTNVMNEAPIAMNPVDDLLINPGRAFAHIIHEDTFHDPDPGDALKFKATSVDGTPLPKWLRFIAIECCFSGKPPADLGNDFELDILLTATDFDGMSAETQIKMRVHYESA